MARKGRGLLLPTFNIFRSIEDVCSCIITSHWLFGEMPFDFAVDFFLL